MTRLDMPVGPFMHSPVVVARLDDTLVSVRDQLAVRRCSSLPVVNQQGTPVGVISRTDLLRVGRVEARRGANGHRRRKPVLLSLPHGLVADVMTKPPIVVGPAVTVSECAMRMCERRVHRVFVVEGDRLAGVFSTRDLMETLAHARVGGRVRDFMSKPVLTIGVEDTISLAAERLECAHVSGLVVVDDEWPVGLFTQTEALEAAAMPRGTLVEEAFSPALICMSEETPLHRAAAQAAATSARRVIATVKSGMSGILTGLDFARAVC
jgi:CBS domain-containing protein